MKQIQSVYLYGSNEPLSSLAIRRIAEAAEADYLLIHTAPDAIETGPFALERMLSIAEDTAAGMVYADYYDRKDGCLYPHPLIDYRKGSLRDDFDFGPLLLYHTAALREAAEDMMESYRFAGLYDLRLKVSQRHPIVHINEYLYSREQRMAQAAEGEQQFDYVNPENRAVQVEMEKACTAHLRQIGAYLPPRCKTIDLGSERFDVEASVIIPVRNRVHTIAEAIRSALEQQTSFPFNVIVVDNHSTDGTTEVIRGLGAGSRLRQLTPARQDLGIGGCWNEAIHLPECGRFAVQLDSDDVYSDSHSLQKIVDAFYEQSCAMLVGAYRLTDFHLQTIPPGLIDHKEWTPENGHNNALRINGLGAPRAFYTPLLRSIKLPNTSYGEDYAAGLRICREYAIGRIYDPLYLCRRWEGNSDASPDVAKLNAYNAYKDSLRTWEVEARILLNKRYGNVE
jgi:GT2 family glycosyltransferase